MPDVKFQYSLPFDQILESIFGAGARALRLSMNCAFRTDFNLGYANGVQPPKER
jgi:hypothetical protein